MALVTDGYELSIVIKDTGNNATVKKYELTAVTAAAAETDALAIIAVLNPVTEGTISSYRVSHKFQEDDFSFPAAAAIEQKASIVALIDGEAVKTCTEKIPSPDVGIMQGADGEAFNLVDIADTALLAYLLVFQTGGEATISDGEVMGAPLRGKRITVGSRKG
ncbi:unnamed protein product [marine sediment metagenome]|uniref:Uncharacterized protein n=1 Tax=marine sediment metagenome TaxID=412755 RepID=X1M836_9ZZZZ